MGLKRMLKIVFYVLLALAMLAALAASFFETPGVPEFVWEMRKVY